jgi:hypothetical protein
MVAIAGANLRPFLISRRVTTERSTVKKVKVIFFKSPMVNQMKTPNTIWKAISS